MRLRGGEDRYTFASASFARAVLLSALLTRMQRNTYYLSSVSWYSEKEERGELESCGAEAEKRAT